MQYAKDDSLTSEDHNQLRCEYPDKVLKSQRKGDSTSEFPMRNGSIKVLPGQGVTSILLSLPPGHMKPTSTSLSVTGIDGAYKTCAVRIAYSVTIF